MTRLALGTLIFLVLATPAARAQPAPPVLTGTVNDFARVIDEASEKELDRRIQALHRASGDVVVVATVPTFQPYADVREYAVKMFENQGRGIGERGKDNGLLIVVAVEDRKVGIEVGYGLEGFVTDGFSGETIREAILPQFRQGQYGRGLLAGTPRGAACRCRTCPARSRFRNDGRVKATCRTRSRCSCSSCSSFFSC